MKNQNDLIISIVAIVLALIIAGVCFGTKREPTAPPAPEKVNLAPPALPQGDVVYATGLPGAGSGSSAAGGGGGFGGGRGPAMGMGGGRPGLAGGGGKAGGPAMADSAGGGASAAMGR